MKKFGLLTLIMLSTTSSLNAQVSLNGGPYIQNFDTYLGTQASVPNGWNVSFQSSTVYNGTGTGTSNTGGAWAFGIGGEYSFGALRSGTPGNVTLSVNFVNNTGRTITEMTIQWSYEQWRYANTSGFDLSATGELAGNTIVNSQDFIGSASGTNGIVTSTAIQVVLDSLSILDGQSFGFIWITTDVSNADNGIAIDDFQITGPSPLPVELSSFSASVVGNAVKLNWRTETEVNNYGFEVERNTPINPLSRGEAEGRGVWERIGFVDGNGNSNSPKTYSFTDNNVLSGKYNYRLKQIDNDGKYEYSKTIEVDLGSPSKFELAQNFPNPFNPETAIRFTLPNAGNVRLTIYNLLGQEVHSLVNEYKEAGTHIINFNASDFNSGVYIYKLEANGITQTRKMTLIK